MIHAAKAHMRRAGALLATLVLVTVSVIAMALGGRYEANADQVVVVNGTTLTFSDDLSTVRGRAYVTEGHYGGGGTGSWSSTFNVSVAGQVVTGYCYQSYYYVPDHELYPAPTNTWADFTGTRNPDGTYALVVDTSGAASYASWVVMYTGYPCQSVFVPGLYIPLKGKGKLHKTSTNKTYDNEPLDLAGNPYYSLAGIKYSVYGSEGAANSNGTHASRDLTLDGNGNSNDSDDLDAGTYWLKETYNPPNSGYITNPSAFSVSVESAKTTDWHTSDPPVYGYVKITKTSLSTGQTVMRAGFEFDLFNSQNVKVGHCVTDASGMSLFKKLNDPSTPVPLPLGDYYAKETFAPEPYYIDTSATYPIQLRQSGTSGDVQGGHKDGAYAVTNRYNNVVDVTAMNKQWGYVQMIKRNVATAGTVKGGTFTYAIYKAGQRTNPLGTATITPSTDGRAYFVDGNGQPLKLPVVNSADSTEGKYDIYEMSVSEPFYPLGEKIRVEIHALGNTGNTQTIISAPDGAGTVFKNGEPVPGTYTQDGELIVPAATSPAAHSSGWEQKNTTPVEEGNDQYAFINVIKKNMELDKTGPTVAQAGFKFKLYYSESDAVNETNWVEEIETDDTGTKPFTTKLPVKGTARNDAGKPGVDAGRVRLGGDANRNDGVYYVRESYAPVPYNKSNLIYRFTLEPKDGQDGTEGQIKAQVDIRIDRNGRNSKYTTSWQPYWSVTTTGNGTVSIHGDNRCSGANVLNVADTTAENAPQYGRATIYKTDAEDGSPQRGAEYQVYALQNVTYTNQRDTNGTPTAGYDSVGGDKQPFGYTKNRSEDVNQMDWPLVHVNMKDVSRTTKIEKGGSSFNAETGAVTVDKPITFMRAGSSPVTYYDTIVTDENGKATTGWLPIGSSGEATYALVEVKSSNGHVIDGTPIVFTLKYDSTLQDRECILATNVTQNNRDDQRQADQPNRIDIYKTVKATPSNPDGGPVEGVTIGFWKEDDDIKVTPKSGDGTYEFDAVAIRTSQGASLVPTVHQRIVGTELHVESLDSSMRAVLILEDHLNDGKTDDPTKDDIVTGGSEGIVVTDNKRIDLTKEGVSDTVPTGRYVVFLIDKETNTALRHTGLQTVDLQEAQRTNLRITKGQLTGAPNVDMDASPIEIRTSNLHYETENDAWIATNLKCGAEYEVEFDRKVVAVIHTTETGGRTWFGRFSYGAESDSPWFHRGWLDQAALPTNDNKIILQSHMNVPSTVKEADQFSTNAIRTATAGQGNQMWLQDTVDTNTRYPYATITDKDGHFYNKRIGTGKYVIAEIKPPVDERLHLTYLSDLHPHYFEVDDVTGYILDTDDKTNLPNRHGYNYDSDRHDGNSHKKTTTKSFIFIDDVTKLRLSKREVTDGEELVGAELILTADNNDVIDRWISTDQPHYVEGLVPGWYRLTEYATPKNYDKAESVEFNLLPTGEIQHTIMLDTPIFIDAEIDKIQEIANPLGQEDRPNGDGRNHADAQPNDNGLYAYSLDFRSASNTWTDEFTVEDPLEPADQGYARLLSLVTPQTFQDYDGKMNVWYTTNKTAEDYRDLESEVPAVAPPAVHDGRDGEDADGQEQDDGITEQPVYTYKANATYEDQHENPWLADDKAMEADEDRDWRIISYAGWKLWQKDVPTAVSTTLRVADLKLPEDEYVTGIRFEYGRVEVGFTSRVEEREWLRENLKYDHDDSAQITGLSTQSFQSNAHAADAAIARMNILTARFTTDMSFILEDTVARQRAQAEEDYKQKLISIDEYNALLSTADDAPLPKFAEALVKPAYVDGTEDVQRLDTYLEASKASLQAAFPLAKDSESRELLLTEAKQAMADLEPIVSGNTTALLYEKIAAYETEIARIPSESGGYDIDNANTEMLNAFLQALDDIRTFGLSGRVPYAPAVLHMQLTENYVPGTFLKNSAKVDAYRNGGNNEDDEDTDEERNLEGHDRDEVVQTPRRKDDIFIGTRLATLDGQKIVEADGTESIVLTDVVDYHNLEPGRTYRLDGILHIRAYDQKAKMQVDGGAVVGSKGSVTFSPEQPDGTVEVKLIMPASENLFKPVVAYEELREVDKKTEVASDIVIAEHKDITNEDQTVQVTMPAEDVVTNTPIIQTGAGETIALVTIGSLAATVGFGVVMFLAKRRQ